MPLTKKSEWNNKASWIINKLIEIVHNYYLILENKTNKIFHNISKSIIVKQIARLLVGQVKTEN